MKRLLLTMLLLVSLFAIAGCDEEKTDGGSTTDPVEAANLR